MDISNIIQVILVGTCLLSGLIFMTWAIAGKSKRARNFGIAVLSFLTVYIVNTSFIEFQNVVYKPTNKISQLQFLAFGNASNGDKGWLGLYEDGTWEFGKSYREINTNGTYVLKGDTVVLTTTGRTDELFEEGILLANNQETSSPDVKLNGLSIEVNKLTKTAKGEL